MSVSLRWLDRHGQFALPASAIAGLAVPSVAQFLATWVPWLVAGSLMLALWRLPSLRSAEAGPLGPSCGHAAALIAWIALVCPLSALGLAHAMEWPAGMRDLVALHALAPPIGAVPAFALMLRLDARTAALATVGATLAFPVVMAGAAPIVLAAGGAAELSELAARIAWVGLLPVFGAFLLRRIVVLSPAGDGSRLVGGINVLLLSLLCAALMDRVGDALLASEAAWQLLSLAVGLTVLHHLFALLAFRPLGQVAAWTSAISAGNRNVALVLAALGASASEDFRVFAGLVQLPMFLSPLVVRMLRGQDGS